jgi:hypothetical protein
MVAEQYLGVPVKCGRCGRSFTTRADAPPQPVRLDLGSASSAGRVGGGVETGFFSQHLVFYHLDERHELAVLVLVGTQRFGAAVALAPLLSNFIAGAKPDPESVAGSIAAACKTLNAPAAIAIIWDGQVSNGGVGDCPIFHQSGGRLARLRGETVRLTGGDWLVLVGNGSHAPLDEIALQREIAGASPSAAALAERLVQPGDSTILAVRCY